MTEIPEWLAEKLEGVKAIHTGDKLIFHFSQMLTQDQAQEIKEQIRYALGDDTPFLVTGKGVESFIIRAENIPENQEATL